MTTCTNPNCGYQWQSRTKKPKSCPKCRQYLKHKLEVTHDTTETTFIAMTPEKEMELQAELEAKHGEQRSAQE